MAMWYPRKTAPGVRGGKVQKKNRREQSPNYFNDTQARPVIDRQRPGVGYRHLLRKLDVSRFIELLPDWDELSRGLDAIVLAPGDECMGWYADGVVALCAWPREIVGEYDADFVAEHRPILDRLAVSCEKRRKNSRFVHWTEGTARGFQLMHILLHELGHHHDLITTASQREASRGEGYAEAYATRNAEELWEKYFAVFGWGE